MNELFLFCVFYLSIVTHQANCSCKILSVQSASYTYPSYGSIFHRILLSVLIKDPRIRHALYKLIFN